MPAYIWSLVDYDNMGKMLRKPYSATQMQNTIGSKNHVFGKIFSIYLAYIDVVNSPQPATSEL
jgi:hypothetical protein